MSSPLQKGNDQEISALIETLRKTEQRLEELTAGEVDSVTDREGRTFLLRRAQDHSRHSEAEKQAAILDALPASIAVLDAQGVIVSVNETWRRVGCANALQDPLHLVGCDYLGICATAPAEDSPEGRRAAEGIRSVLEGRARNFSTEYPCRSPAETRWFLLTVTPLADHPPNGAIVMHLDITAERRTEESLRVSESRFRQMAENIGEVFFLSNLDSSQMYYISPAYERIWGRTVESLYADPTSWADSIHPDDPHHPSTIFDGDATLGFDYECRIIRPDGETRWIHVRGFPIRDEDGIPYRTAGVASDITQRKRASNELQESERRFSALLGNVEMVSVMLDTTGRITYCNDYLLRLTGWRREELIGQDWFERFIPPDLELRDLFNDLLADLPSTWRHENEILIRSGGNRLIQWNNTVLRSAAGEVTGTASIGLDITERKQAEATLRLQSAALNAADNAMFITERDGTIVWTNPAFTGLTGYASKEALGTNPRDLVRSGVHDHDFYKDMWDTLLAGESWSGEMTNRHKDGRFYPEAQTITPVKDDDDTITHFISISTDLTALREMEEQLRQSQKMEAVGQLAAGVAHEFNNVLQALMSMTAILRLRTGKMDDARIVEMESQIKRGAGLTEQLLLFSRSHATRKVNLDLRETLRKASVLLRQVIPETIRIDVETPPQRLSVDVDAGQMQQVLLNLAINARDAMPGGGTLTLRARCDGAEVSLEVEDTGHGLDEKTRARIFEPFFTTKDVGKGTGLGLAVVHGIVKQHGGRIEVESRPGAGTLFRITLPETLWRGLPATETTEETDIPAGSGRILLVEDEEEVRSGIAILLELIGYEVTAVASGEEAKALPREPAPDLLLSDVTLPGIAGSALGEHLRERWPSLRVVLMSGYIEEAVRAGAVARGWHFLQKPFEMKELASHLRTALDEETSGPVNVSDWATPRSTVA